MRISSPLSALGAAAAMILLVGCSGGGSSAVAPVIGTQAHARGASHFARGPVSMIPKWMLGAPRSSHLVFRNANANLISHGGYVSSFGATTINEYKLPNSANNPPFCMVSGVSAPNGIGVQPKTRHLYIPDGGSRTVIIHKTACGPQVGSALADPNGQPSDVAFNDATGTVYVPNIFNTTGGGSIQVYKKHDLTPSSQLSDPTFNELLGIDTDKDGNVWQAFVSTTGAPGIMEFVGGKMPGVLHTITGPSLPGGIEFDKNQNMIVIDINSTTPAAYVYVPPYSGAPSNVIPLMGGSVFGKLDCLDQNFYVGDFINGTMDVYQWPSGTYEYSVSNGLSQANTVEGVAIDAPDRE